MNLIWKQIVGAGLLSLAALVASAAPVGDTQGVVSAVRVTNAVGGLHSFEIWFSSTTRDRWGCIQASGYIVVSENGSGVTPQNYQRLFAVALAAQASGKTLALDSAGTNPCQNVNMAWMLD